MIVVFCFCSMQNVFVAGTDTSAATVVWAMTLLMKNPMAMKKAQEEVRKLVGKKGFVEEADELAVRHSWCRTPHCSTL